MNHKIIKEIEAEEKAINEYLNSEKEIEIEAFADEKFVTNLIEKYESEIKGEDKQSPTKAESSTNQGTGSKTSTEKTKVNEESQVTEDTNSPTKEVIEQPVVSEDAQQAGKFEEKARKIVCLLLF
mgnify:CR=1 FL=1